MRIEFSTVTVSGTSFTSCSAVRSVCCFIEHVAPRMVCRSVWSLAEALTHCIPATLPRLRSFARADLHPRPPRRPGLLAQSCPCTLRIPHWAGSHFALRGGANLELGSACGKLGRTRRRDAMDSWRRWGGLGMASWAGILRWLGVGPMTNRRNRFMCYGIGPCADVNVNGMCVVVCESHGARHAPAVGKCVRVHGTR